MSFNSCFVILYYSSPIKESNQRPQRRPESIDTLCWDIYFISALTYIIVNIISKYAWLFYIARYIEIKKTNNFITGWFRDPLLISWSIKHTHTHTRTHARTHARKHTRTHTHTHTHTRTHTRTRTHGRTHARTYSNQIQTRYCSVEAHMHTVNN